jgi:hypothetical protein
MDFQVKRKPVVPVKPEVESITITLSIKEARFLQAVMGKVGGYDALPEVGFRAFTSDLWNKIYEQTDDIYPYEDRISGSLTIK